MIDLECPPRPHRDRTDLLLKDLHRRTRSIFGVSVAYLLDPRPPHTATDVRAQMDDLARQWRALAVTGVWQAEEGAP